MNHVILKLQKTTLKGLPSVEKKAYFNTVPMVWGVLKCLELGFLNAKIWYILKKASL